MLGLPMLKTGRASPLLSWLSHFLRDSVTDTVFQSLQWCSILAIGFIDFFFLVFRHSKNFPSEKRRCYNTREIANTIV